MASETALTTTFTARKTAMAINLHNTPSGVTEPGLPPIGLLRYVGAPCRVPSRGEALALLDGLLAIDVADILADPTRPLRDMRLSRGLLPNGDVAEAGSI